MSPPLPKQDGATSPLVVSLQKTCQSQVLTLLPRAFVRAGKQEGAGPPCQRRAFTLV
jgi:hypothetical protein